MFLTLVAIYAVSAFFVWQTDEDEPEICSGRCHDALLRSLGLASTVRTGDQCSFSCDVLDFCTYVAGDEKGEWDLDQRCNSDTTMCWVAGDCEHRAWGSTESTIPCPSMRNCLDTPECRRHACESEIALHFISKAHPGKHTTCGSDSCWRLSPFVFTGLDD